MEDGICGIECERYDEAAETGLEGTALPGHQCTCDVLVSTNIKLQDGRRPSSRRLRTMIGGGNAMV